MIRLYKIIIYFALNNNYESKIKIGLFAFWQDNVYQSKSKTPYKK